jgi:hypothetical protein
MAGFASGVGIALVADYFVIVGLCQVVLSDRVVLGDLKPRMLHVKVTPEQAVSAFRQLTGRWHAAAFT